MARPTKLDPQRTEKLIKCIEGGMNYEDACRFAGITYKTFSNWMAKGRESKSGRFFQFLQDINEAKARGVAFHLGVINNAARNGDWHASRFILQARHGYVINKEPAPQLNIQLNAESMNINNLLEEVKSNALLLTELNEPVIDLDEE